MTEIPEVYRSTLENYDIQCTGQYALGICRLSEELGLPRTIDRYTEDDYINADSEWVEAMLNARELFKKKLAEMKQTQEWEESWNRFDKEDPPI